MTDYDPGSELMRLCLRPVGEPTRVSPELFDILRESERVSRETGGAFDVTVWPYVRAWRAARKTRKLPTPEEIAEMRKAVGYEKLRLDSSTRSVTLLAPHMTITPWSSLESSRRRSPACFGRLRFFLTASMLPA